MLQELSNNGLITVYVSGGKEYFFVTGWKHQRIDKPHSPKYPDPFADDSTNIPRTIPLDRIGNDRIGNDRIVEVAPEALPAKKSRGTRLSEDWQPNLEGALFAEGLLGADAVHCELEKFKDYWISLPGQRAVKLDWDRTWKNWCRNSQEKFGGKGNVVKTGNVVASQDKLIETIRKFDEKPRVCGPEGTAAVRLLPKG
jgi:hypothetical protein